MNPFTYQRVASTAAAIQAKAAHPESTRFIAGGTNLLDLMKESVLRPQTLIDITHLPLDGIEDTADGGLRIGALVSNADLAWHPRVQADYPLLSQALLAGASPQLRNMATTGGNLLQRTRCYYFYDIGTPCNKRAPGTGCGAIGGVNRIHAILGTSDQCIATHPSDMCVAMAALEARIHVEGPGGARRTIPMADFHRLPGDTPERDTNLEANELIVAVELPPPQFQAHTAYFKIRDRRSYAFALVSAAAALQLRDDGRIGAARVALGGVAHKPWRKPEAEAPLVGQLPAEADFGAVATSLLEGAKGQGHNDFKIEMARRTIVRALQKAAGLEEKA